MVRVKQGPRGGKYIIVNGRKKYLPKSSKKNKNEEHYRGGVGGSIGGVPCQYSEDMQIPNDQFPTEITRFWGNHVQYLWHYSMCTVGGQNYLHVTAFRATDWGIYHQGQRPAVHYGYRPQNLHLGPVLWSSPGWMDMHDSPNIENVITQFISNIFNEAQRGRVIENGVWRNYGVRRDVTSL